MLLFIVKRDFELFDDDCRKNFVIAREHVSNLSKAMPN